MTTVLINDRWPLVLTEDRAAQWDEWRRSGGWEVERIAHMYDNIRSGDVVFDVGAEVGDLPALWASWGAQVVMFEPNPYIWPLIRHVWELNGLKPLGAFAGFACNQTIEQPVQVESAFLGDPKDGWPRCAYGRFTAKQNFRNCWERFHDTPSMKLDDFCERAGLVPQVLTMDVEGAELEVLRGAEQVLRQHRPLVYVSVHPAFIADAWPYTDADLHAFMAGLGYVGEHIADDHESHWCFRP